MQDMKYVTAQGNECAADSPDVAYQVNPSDPKAEEFVNSLKGFMPSSVLISGTTGAAGSAPFAEAKPPLASAKK